MKSMIPKLPYKRLIHSLKLPAYKLCCRIRYLISWKWALVLIYLSVVIAYYILGSRIKYVDLLYTNDLYENITKILILLLPSSIAIFTFTSKERKDASSFGLKTSNSTFGFVSVIFFSFTAFSFLSMYKILYSNTNANNEFYQKLSSILNDYFHFETLGIGFSLFNLSLGILFFGINLFQLITSHNIENTFRKSVLKTEKSFLKLTRYYKYNLGKRTKKIKLITNTTNLIESNFQYLKTLTEAGHYRLIKEHQDKLILINDQFLNRIITPTDKDELIRFVYSYHNGYVYLLELDELEDIAEKLIDSYSVILSHYKDTIGIAASKNLVDLQRRLIKALLINAPVALLDTSADMQKNPLFRGYVNDICRKYFEILFLTVTNNEYKDVMNYSSLTEIVSSNEIPLTELRRGGIGRTSPIHTSYHDNLTLFFEYLIMWSIEKQSNNHLTETVNALLKVRNSIIKRNNTKVTEEKNDTEIDLSNIKESAASFKDLFDNKLKLSDEFLNSIDLNNEEKIYELPTEQMDKTGTSIIETGFIFNILLGLLKSVELNYYGLSGYLIKILLTNFNNDDINSTLELFYDKITNDDHIDFISDTGYFHYSFARHSLDYCLNKLVLLITLQQIYKGSVPFKINSYKPLLETIDFPYLKEKINSAGNKYGMLSINQENLNKLENYFNQ
jgi:hypothetical protein